MTSFCASPKTNPMPSVPSASTSQQPNQQQIATIETLPPPGSGANMPIPTVTCDLASDISTSEACDNENQNGGKDTLQVSTIATTHSPLAARTSSNGTKSPTHELQISPLNAPQGRCRALSVGIDTDMVSEFDPSSSDSGIVSRCAAVKPLKFKIMQPLFGKKNAKKREGKGAKHDKKQQQEKQQSQQLQQIKSSNSIAETTELEPVMPKTPKPRDPEKEKRRIARKKEKRATLILGLIMGSFIACWLPFFFLYILTPACKKCKIPEAAFAIAFWLGYMNSALNPAIYTIFNKDFRRAFRRILFK